MRDIQYFTTLNDFISFRKECVFCNKTLIPILTNFVGANRGLKISDINVPLTKNNFVFKLKIHSTSMSIEEDCSINIHTNEFITGCDLNFSDFQCLGPHIELQCRNISCKYNYYLSSSILSSKLQDNCNKQYINTVIVDMECCNIPKFWIQNDYVDHLTRIFSTKESGVSPIETSFIIFNKLEKDKLINKIKTIVNFS